MRRYTKSMVASCIVEILAHSLRGGHVQRLLLIKSLLRFDLAQSQFIQLTTNKTVLLSFVAILFFWRIAIVSLALPWYKVSRSPSPVVSPVLPLPMFPLHLIPRQPQVVDPPPWLQPRFEPRD